MAQESAISWTDSTFNPWIGCTKVGPACDGCYADALMGQGGRHKRATWGGPGQRSVLSRTAASTWAAPVKWNKAQAKLLAAYEDLCAALDVEPRQRPRPAPPAPWFVFCASLSDVFDKDAPVEWRRDLFDLIRATPHLTWLLLTKRPQNIARLYGEAMGDLRTGETWPRNAAIGCTVVTQAEADRDVIHLLRAKEALQPAFAFLSMEPLLEAVNLTRLHLKKDWNVERHWIDALVGEEVETNGPYAKTERWPVPRLDWVITGGETDQGGHKARPQNPQWFRDLRDQCAAAGVPFQHKQNGEWSGPGPHLPGGLNPREVARYDGLPVFRVGKALAGRLLDGVEHNARPVPR